MSFDRVVLQCLCTELAIAPLSPEDYDFLIEYVSIFKPIAEGITFLEGNQQMCGSYLPTLYGIEARLNDIRNESLAYCGPLLDAVIAGFQRRFGDKMDPSKVRSVPLFIAMISNPKYKLSFLPPNLLRPTFLKQVKTIMLKAAEKIIQENDAFESDSFEADESATPVNGEGI